MEKFVSFKGPKVRQLVGGGVSRRGTVPKDPSPAGATVSSGLHEPWAESFSKEVSPLLRGKHDVIAQTTVEHPTFP